MPLFWESCEADGLILDRFLPARSARSASVRMRRNSMRGSCPTGTCEEDSQWANLAFCSDEYCPHCDNHFVIEAIEPQAKLHVEGDDARMDSRYVELRSFGRQCSNHAQHAQGRTCRSRRRAFPVQHARYLGPHGLSNSSVHNWTIHLVGMAQFHDVDDLMVTVCCNSP